MIEINRKTDALIVIDIQKDFCPGGALAVEKGDKIIPGVAELAKRFSTVVLTQDWHPQGHSSFASTHGKEPFRTMEASYGEQTLWPDHCVQGSSGSMFHDDIYRYVTDRASLIIRKGMNKGVDSYSAFYENDKKTTTGLGGYLNDREIKRVFLVGLAYDFCVAYSAMDAVSREGLDAFVVKDLTRAIAMPVPLVGSLTNTAVLATEKMEKIGVEIIELNDLQGE